MNGKACASISHADVEIESMRHCERGTSAAISISLQGDCFVLRPRNDVGILLHHHLLHRALAVLCKHLYQIDAAGQTAYINLCVTLNLFQGLCNYPSASHIPHPNLRKRCAAFYGKIGLKSPKAPNVIISIVLIVVEHRSPVRPKMN